MSAATQPAGWQLPVRMLHAYEINGEMVVAGRQVYIPANTAILLDRAGYAELLLPRVDMTRETMHDPFAPVRPPGPHGGLTW